MKTDYEKFERGDGNSRLLRQETLIVDVLEEVNRVLSSENISKTSLAQRLGKTKGYISQILSGGRNLTLRTVADVCWAIGYAPHFELRKDSHLAALPSIKNRINDVDWTSGEFDGQQGQLELTMDSVKVTCEEVSGPPMAANQELGLVA